MTAPFYVSTVNAQGVTSSAPIVLRNVQTTLPGIALAGLQEVAPLRGPHTLRKSLPGRLVGVHHNTRTPALAGSAVVWDKTRVSVIDRGVELLATPEAGDDLRKRYGHWVMARVDQSNPFLFMAAHRPLNSTGDQPEFDANLARFLEGYRALVTPWIVAMDANARELPRLRSLGRWRHAGIDGFLVDRRIVTGAVFKLPNTPSDHWPVALEVRL